MIWVFRASLSVLVSKPNKPHDNGLVGDTDVADRLQGGLGWGMRWDQGRQPNHRPAGVLEVLPPRLAPLAPAKNHPGGSVTQLQVWMRSAIKLDARSGP